MRATRRWYDDFCAYLCEHKTASTSYDRIEAVKLCLYSFYIQLWQAISQWQRAFLTQQHSPRENGLSELSLLSSLSPSYWCLWLMERLMVLWWTIASTGPVNWVLGPFIASPKGGKSFVHNRACIETTTDDRRFSKNFGKPYFSIIQHGM